MAYVRTARGQTIDMGALIKQHQNDIALGNGHMNVRGDIVKKGKIVKTVEERRRDMGKFDFSKLQKQTPVASEIPVFEEPQPRRRNKDKKEHAIEQVVETPVEPVEE